MAYMNNNWLHKDIKEVIKIIKPTLVILTVIFAILACSTVSAATTSNNSTTQLSSNTSTYNNSTITNTINSSSEVVITGKVTKCSNGDDFSGVTVTASKNGVKLASIKTKSDGTYVLRFTNKDTTFTVTASYPGHTSSSKTVTITNLKGFTNFQLGTDNVYVSTTGSDTTGDGTQNKPYKTIQKALENVNSGGTIHLANGIYAGAGNSGLTIAQNVNIIGESQANTIIDAQHLTNTFNITSVAQVTLQNLTLTNGKTDVYGGAIHNLGTITASNCIFTNNTAKDSGAIYNQGTITLNNCIFTSNTASIGGGVIYNGGNITLSGCDFTNNKASVGSAIANEGTITVSGCSFTSNTASAGGGIIYNGGNITMNSCNFTSNTATQYGGAIYNMGNISLSSCNFTNNTANEGGTIYNSGIITVNNCSFTSNTANDSGGAIYNRGNITISSCNFTSSTANEGGAIYNAHTTNLNGCNFTNNTATDYGGAINNQGTITVSSCGFTSNTATQYGGAIYNYNGSLTANYNRFYKNTATLGSAIYHYGDFVDANYNWWGSNKDPKTISNLISVGDGSIDATYWVILSVNATPNSINNTQKSTVTADLNHYTNKAGYVGKLSNYIPDGPVTLNVSWGSFTSSGITHSITLNTINGLVTATFYANEGAVNPLFNPVKVTATADDYTTNDTESAYITINIQNYDDSSNENPNNENTVKAASKTAIGLQNAGLPLNYLILAVLMVLSGLVPRRK